MSDYEVQYLMTNDKEHTMQAADTQLAHADFVLLNLAEQVRDAEERALKAAKQVADTTARVIGHLERGATNNSLGELQANAVYLDVAVGQLEQAVKAFTQAESYLGRGFPNQGKDEANTAMKAMYDHYVAGSARLQAIVR